MRPLQQRPVPRLAEPGYPTRRAADADPDLLLRHMPPPWLGRADLVRAAGVLLAASATGCSRDAPQDVNQPVHRVDSNKPALVAPLFEHGEGTGAAGCSVITSPVYLSEEQALQIIADELARHGIQLSPREHKLDAVSIKYQRWRQDYEWVSNSVKSDMEYYEGPLVADGVDTDRQIAVEFISNVDHGAFAGPWQTEARALAWTFDYKEAANWLRGEVAGARCGMVIGVFYDPLTDFDFRKAWHAKQKGEPLEPNMPGPDDGASWAAELIKEADELEAPYLIESGRQLQAQVRDFAAWLKGQGVL